MNRKDFIKGIILSAISQGLNIPESACIGIARAIEQPEFNRRFRKINFVLRVPVGYAKVYSILAASDGKQYYVKEHGKAIGIACKSIATIVECSDNHNAVVLGSVLPT